LKIVGALLLKILVKVNWADFF